jgi:2-polyprenyl-3-methyl-5-hydroxy-6-metoxy-1,4-benzoquinol methylase
MGGWNHNLHYHDVVLRAVPADCQRALDVGCGQGQLALELAQHCEEVVAIDADRETLTRARSACSREPRMHFVEGDVMNDPFAEGSFDFISAVATLHHLPLRPALERFQSLLRPGGVLALIGLYRPQTIEDYAWAAAAFPASRVLKWLRGRTEVTAPLQEPKETLSEIRAACEEILPGGVFRRRLFFRYSFVWRKP